MQADTYRCFDELNGYEQEVVLETVLTVLEQLYNGQLANSDGNSSDAMSATIKVLRQVRYPSSMDRAKEILQEALDIISSSGHADSFISTCH
jgi:hypothetical protein